MLTALIQLNDISELIKGTNASLDKLPNISDIQRIKKVHHGCLK